MPLRNFQLPNAPKPIPTPNVPIKKSDSGISNKLLLAQAYCDELNILLLKRKVLNNTVRLYQDRIKKLACLFFFLLEILLDY